MEGRFVRQCRLAVQFHPSMKERFIPHPIYYRLAYLIISGAKIDAMRNVTTDLPANGSILNEVGAIKEGRLFWGRKLKIVGNDVIFAEMGFGRGGVNRRRMRRKGVTFRGRAKQSNALSSSSHNQRTDFVPNPFYRRRSRKV